MLTKMTSDRFHREVNPTLSMPRTELESYVRMVELAAIAIPMKPLRPLSLQPDLTCERFQLDLLADLQLYVHSVKNTPSQFGTSVVSDYVSVVARFLT